MEKTSDKNDTDGKDTEERKIFKGSHKALSELANFTPIQFLESNIPAQPAGNWGNIPAQKMPGTVIYHMAAKSYYGDAFRRFTFLNAKNNFNPVFADLPANFVVNALEGRQGQEMLMVMEKWQYDHLSAAIVPVGMTSGADPEIFVERGDGTLLNAFEFLGSKTSPNKAPGAPPYGSNKLYWDGFQAEFTVYPTHCISYVVDSIHYGLRGILEAAQKVDPKARLSLKNVVQVNPDVLKSAKKAHVEFGCAPSLNAYGLEGNKLPGREVPFRFAGGHMHLGVNVNGAYTDEQYRSMVKAMDAILAVSCVPMFAAIDNPVRREFYGLPGEYRLPPHGLEYRALSNAWLAHPILVHLVFDLGRNALKLGASGLLHMWKAEEKETIDIVRSCDVDGAKKVMDRNKDFLLKLLSINPAYAASAKRAFSAFYNGAETIVRDPKDIAGNWDLTKGWIPHSGAPGKCWTLAQPVFDKKERV